MKNLKHHLRGALIFCGLAIALFGSSHLHAGYSVIHHFTGGVEGGEFFGTEGAGLTLSDGDLYGVTLIGGSNGMGSIYRLATDGSNFTTVFSFSPSTGGFPGGPPTVEGGKLYGFTGDADGVIYSVNTDGTDFTILHTFEDITGRQPQGTPVILNNVLYGVTQIGGTQGAGVIFSINLNGSQYTVLHNFSPAQGGYPADSLTTSNGRLFGAASAGPNGAGILFLINPDGSNFSVIANLNDTGGFNPSGVPSLDGSEIYFGTSSGGSPVDGFPAIGAVFKGSSESSEVQELYSFGGATGVSPTGTVVPVGEHVYGLSLSGFLYRVARNQNAFDLLHTFSTATGSMPGVNMAYADGVFYGVTSSGGNFNEGVVFSYKIDPLFHVESPTNRILGNGGEKTFITVAGTPVTSRFTIRNTGVSDLELTSASVTGDDLLNFVISGFTSGNLSPGEVSTFTVEFSPTTGVDKIATLQVLNDSDQNDPYEIQLLGRVVDASTDTDEDGLGDAAEFALEAVGFDWDLNQEEMVAALNENANAAGFYTQTQFDANRVAGQNEVLESPNTFGLFTTDQVQDLNFGMKLLPRDGEGAFTLVLGLEKTSSLSTQFIDFPFDTAGTSLEINDEGKLEFHFTVPGNSAFFRLNAK